MIFINFVRYITRMQYENLEESAIGLFFPIWSQTPFNQSRHFLPFKSKHRSNQKLITSRKSVIHRCFLSLLASYFLFLFETLTLENQKKIKEI